MRILPCNHIISDAPTSQRENYVPDNTQYSQETTVAKLPDHFSQRGLYWAEQATRHATWIANGGFAQEECNPAPAPAIDLQTMPDDPIMRDFYWTSTQLLARMRRRPAAQRGGKTKQTRNYPK